MVALSLMWQSMLWTYFMFKCYMHHELCYAYVRFTFAIQTCRASTVSAVWLLRADFMYISLFYIPCQNCHLFNIFFNKTWRPYFQNLLPPLWHVAAAQVTARSGTSTIFFFIWTLLLTGQDSSEIVWVFLWLIPSKPVSLMYALLCRYTLVKIAMF